MGSPCMQGVVHTDVVQSLRAVLADAAVRVARLPSLTLVHSSSADTGCAMPAGGAGGLMAPPGAGPGLATSLPRVTHTATRQRGQQLSQPAPCESFGRPGEAGVGASRWQHSPPPPPQPEQERAARPGAPRAQADRWPRGQALAPLARDAHGPLPALIKSASAWQVGRLRPPAVAAITLRGALVACCCCSAGHAGGCACWRLVGVHAAVLPCAFRSRGDAGGPARLPPSSAVWRAH